MADSTDNGDDNGESLLEILRSQQYSNVLKNVYSSASNVIDPLKHVNSNIVNSNYENQKFLANTGASKFNPLQSNHLNQSVFAYLQNCNAQNILKTLHIYNLCLTRPFQKKLQYSNQHIPYESRKACHVLENFLNLLILELKF